MKLFTKEILEKLRKNDQVGGDHPPVVKIFDPCGPATWLLQSMDEQGLCFGLCDLGMGFPELGYVGRDELETVRGRLGLHLERDMHWTPEYPLSEYAERARQAGYID